MQSLPTARTESSTIFESSVDFRSLKFSGYPFFNFLMQSVWRTCASIISPVKIRYSMCIQEFSIHVANSSKRFFHFLCSYQNGNQTCVRYSSLCISLYIYGTSKFSCPHFIIWQNPLFSSYLLFL